MPELTYDTQEAVPQDFRSDAVAKDGKFVVDVVPSKKLAEFRDNNIRLSQERDKFSNLFGRLKTDLGLEEDKVDEFVNNFAELRTTDQLVKDGKLVKDTSLEDAVLKRTGSMKNDYESRITGQANTINAQKSQIDTLQKALDDTVIDKDITAAVGDPRSGAKPEALRGIIREARDFFKVVDGKLVAKDASGATIYGSDGSTPMSPLEWIKTRLSQSDPYFFKESQGGGAGGGGQPGNMTHEQLMKLAPAERMRLGRLAGQGRV